MEGLELREELDIVGGLSHKADEVETCLYAVVVVLDIEILQMYIVLLQH